jgi:hypothetical protein
VTLSQTDGALTLDASEFRLSARRVAGSDPVRYVFTTPPLANPLIGFTLAAGPDGQPQLTLAAGGEDNEHYVLTRQGP